MLRIEKERRTNRIRGNAMRRRLLGAMLSVALMVGLLVPLGLLLSSGADTALDQKQAAIARALELEQERKALPAPVSVQPVMDIEDIWAIEDTRTEAEHALVTQMYREEEKLGYDAESSTFYCTLGIDTGDAWPEISLNVRGAEGVQVVWVDDYSYDWCEDAISQGYRYELLAYTQDEFAYIGLVFTGMPIVTLDVEDEIGRQDVPGRATISAAGYAPVDTAVIAHERGGGYFKVISKWSYKMEFHTLGANGKDEKNVMSVLGMEPDSDWLLLANAQDNTTVRNKIAWDIWNDWHAQGEGLMCMDSELVELFINDEYKGIYQLMQRVQPEREISRIGGDVSSDIVLRIISSVNDSTKPVWDLTKEDVDFRLEYRYEPNGNDRRVFDLAKDYVELSRRDEAKQMDDAEFEKTLLERVDIESMLHYILFFHACSLRDNICNNIYLFMLEDDDGRMMIHHAPWDMDTAFWVKPPSEPHDSLRWPDLSMVLPRRMLDLDIGNCRERMWQIWREKRATILSDEAIYERFTAMEEYVNATGAYLRETEKWYGGATELNLSEMEYYEERNLNLVELTMEEHWPIDGAMIDLQ